MQHLVVSKEFECTNSENQKYHHIWLISVWQLNPAFARLGLSILFTVGTCTSHFVANVLTNTLREIGRCGTLNHRNRNGARQDVRQRKIKNTL